MSRHRKHAHSKQAVAACDVTYIAFANPTWGGTVTTDYTNRYGNILSYKQQATFAFVTL